MKRKIRLFILATFLTGSAVAKAQTLTVLPETPAWLTWRVALNLCIAASPLILIGTAFFVVFLFAGIKERQNRRAFAKLQPHLPSNPTYRGDGTEAFRLTWAELAEDEDEKRSGKVDRFLAKGKEVLVIFLIVATLVGALTAIAVYAFVPLARHALATGVGLFLVGVVLVRCSKYSYAVGLGGFAALTKRSDVRGYISGALWGPTLYRRITHAVYGFERPAIFASAEQAVAAVQTAEGKQVMSEAFLIWDRAMTLRLGKVVVGMLMLHLYVPPVAWLVFGKAVAVFSSGLICWIAVASCLFLGVRSWEMYAEFEKAGIDTFWRKLFGTLILFLRAPLAWSRHLGHWLLLPVALLSLAPTALLGAILMKFFVVRKHADAEQLFGELDNLPKL
ncbi:hypothetical protein DB347_17885 [Opitutaceae bacterium EW11]|nr:hypothetical protein DB347_17885 [Opitutaceae bacterium EW11]